MLHPSSGAIRPVVSTSQDRAGAPLAQAQPAASTITAVRVMVGHPSVSTEPVSLHDSPPEADAGVRREPAMIETGILADGYPDAITWLHQRRTLDSPNLPAYADEVLVNAEQHLRERFRHWRRGVRITTEQQAMAFVKGCAVEMQEAAKALEQAAAHLKASGKLMPANQAFVASRRIAHAAEGILS